MTRGIRGGAPSLLRTAGRRCPIGWVKAACAVAGAAFLAGCHTDMWVQPKLRPYQPDEFFADNRSARDPVPGTIARGHLRLDKAFYTGFDDDGRLVTKLPVTLTLNGQKLDTRKDLLKVLVWGRERYTAFCSECHGARGDGNGMINQRGLVLRRSPANYNTDRLRAMPIGHFFDAITNGYGIMMSSAARVSPDDRWAIIAYIRTLQFSRHANLSDVAPEDLPKLQAGGAR